LKNVVGSIRTAGESVIQSFRYRRFTSMDPERRGIPFLPATSH
jgi:hypothetical protein